MGSVTPLDSRVPSDTCYPFPQEKKARRRGAAPLHLPSPLKGTAAWWMGKGAGNSLSASLPLEVALLHWDQGRLCGDLGLNLSVNLRI